MIRSVRNGLTGHREPKGTREENEVNEIELREWRGLRPGPR